MKINRNRYSHNFKSTIFIHFQYQSFNCFWLLLIIIDFIDYRKPLIDNAGTVLSEKFSSYDVSILHLTMLTSFALRVRRVLFLFFFKNFFNWFGEPPNASLASE